MAGLAELPYPYFPYFLVETFKQVVVQAGETPAYPYWLVSYSSLRGHEISTRCTFHGLGLVSVLHRFRSMLHSYGVLFGGIQEPGTTVHSV